MKEDVVNLVLLTCAVVYAFCALVPESRELAAAHAGLYLTFSDEYADFSFQDFQAQVTTLEDASELLQSVSTRFFELPSTDPGSIFHMLDGRGYVVVPTLTIGYRPDGGSNVVEVTAALNESTSVGDAVASIMQDHPADCMVTVELLMQLGVSSGSGGVEQWAGSWKGEVDLHHSVMSVKGIFRRSGDVAGMSVNDMLFSGVLCISCLVLLCTRSSSKHARVVGAAFLVAAVLTWCNAIPHVDADNVLDARRLSVGVACFLACHYFATATLQRVPLLCLVHHSIETATPHLWSYMTGVMPIFLGYAIAGVALFGSDDDHFGSVWRAAVTLFCAIFGDSLLDIFTTMDEQVSEWEWCIVSRCYFVSFLVLFITNILNVGLSIMQDSHALAKNLRVVHDNEEERVVPVAALLHSLGC